MDWLAPWGLQQAEELCERIVELSPLDGEGLPSAMAYPWACGSVSASEEEFQVMLLDVLRDERRAVIKARSRK
jgi:hypothetical protein